MPKRRVGRSRKRVHHRSVKLGRPSHKRGRRRVGFISSYGDYKQTGTRKSLKADRARSAMRSGYRVSKTGRKYFETRKNRSDSKGTRI